MHSLLALWLPIVVSAVFVFLLSFLLHMLLPWHKGDYPGLPDEDSVMEALRPLGIPPGEYVAPRLRSGEGLQSPEFVARMNRGPVFMLRMLPNGMTAMGPMLAQWFVYLLVVAALAGHLAQGAMLGRADGHHLFHTVALAAFMGYCVALWQMSIWYHRRWVVTLKATVDGLLYGLVTGGVFVWLWPG